MFGLKFGMQGLTGKVGHNLLLKLLMRTTPCAKSEQNKLNSEFWYVLLEPDELKGN